MYARIVDGKDKQLLKDHLENVAKYSQKKAEVFGLSNMMYLAGILHDMGKATQAFQNYLSEGDSAKKCHSHSLTGAVFVYERWYVGGFYKRLTAQILSMTVLGHHAGLTDCLDFKGDSPYLRTLKKEKKEVFYDEAINNYFLIGMPSIDKLDTIFAEAVREIEIFSREKMEPVRFIRNKNDYYWSYVGMLARVVESILIDADRWDSACFAEGKNLLEEKENLADWGELQSRFDTFRNNSFPCKQASTKRRGSERINAIRSEISDLSWDSAKSVENVLSMCVPTGGGKTFSSLRFALERAHLRGNERIFYIIPYNTILEQNAEDIRNALDNYEGILEHHSNVIILDDENEGENLKRYKNLSDRWDTEIILTSMVHFMEAAYRKENGKCRRFYRLSNSVIIFDEIQALPKNLKGLFERLISFLSTCCNSTILLCTATQPKLDIIPPPKEIISARSFEREMSRVRYHWNKDNLDKQGAAKQLTELVVNGKSVLCIVNKKKTAEYLYETVKTNLLERSIAILEGTKNREEGVRLVHLTTNMCPAHRKELLSLMKEEMKKRTIVCISTALIEAGVNISFPTVVRSLAGLPSIVQAAGRCNRNMEAGEGKKGDVYVWRIDDDHDENYLRDIFEGKKCSLQIFEEYHDKLEYVDTREVLNQYFRAEYDNYVNKYCNYPYERFSIRTSLVDLLAGNQECGRIASDRTYFENFDIVLRQSFREAGSEFHVIDQNTKTILVPYGEEGKLLIAALGENVSIQAKKELLRKAQRYAVNVFPGLLAKLKDAVYEIGDTGILALREEYYNEMLGVTLEQTSLMNAVIY